VGAFHDPNRYAFVPAFEASFQPIRAELLALSDGDFAESPDSLTTVSDRYDERGWRYFALFGDAAECETNRARCPATARACGAVPGLVNAGFSLFRPGTHLHPHRCERAGLLRCHLALVVPEGDVAIRAGGETRRWEEGRCLILDDTFEHEAWNHAASDRVVLIVTFGRDGERGTRAARTA
jgi:beta-hydroxylase